MKKYHHDKQLQFNRNVPAVPENLALRFSNPRPIIIEKLKAPSDQKNLDGSEDPSIRSSGMFSVISEERLKLAIQLAKRDIKRRHLEEQVKRQVFGDAVNKPLLAQKSQQQKTEVFVSPENKNALKSQTCLKYQQKLGQPSKVETTTSGATVYLYTPNKGKLRPAGFDSPPTHDIEPHPKPNVNKKEDKSMQEVRRLQKELRSYVQKIEELTKKGREKEILDPDKEQQVYSRRQKQAARSARMLYVLQQQVKEIQDDLEKLSPHKIKHTKKSRAVSRLAAAHRGAVRALQAFASHFTDQTGQQIPTHYKELGSLIRQLSLCSAKLEVDSSISDIIIDILLQVEDLDSLLEKKQTPKNVKKCISASQGKSLRNTETFPARKQLKSPKGENKPLLLKDQHGQEPRKPPAARSLLTGLYFELLDTFLSVTLPSAVQFCSMLGTLVKTILNVIFFLLEQQVASIAKRPTSPHPIQITKLMGHTEPEANILFEKLFDSNDTAENKEAEEKSQTGNDIVQPLAGNSLRKECSVCLSVPEHMLQSILDYSSRYKHHLKLISHEAVGSFNPWQIAESLAEQLTEEALCDVAAELQDVCEDYAEAVFTSEFLQPAH
uniref:KIAA0753 n=1 Tax=Athene cunicularia TaxID=194338 RepID=A0A663M8G1_ATHCN